MHDWIEQATGDRRAEGILRRVAKERCGNELAGDLAPRVHRIEVIEEPDERDGGHARQDLPRHRHEVAFAHADEGVRDAECSNQAQEHGQAAEVGHRVLVQFPLLVGLVDDACLHRHQPHERRGDERHQERDQEHRCRLVEDRHRSNEDALAGRWCGRRERCRDRILLDQPVASVGAAWIAGEPDP